MVVNEHEAEALSPQQALAQIGYLRELVDDTRLRAADGYPIYLLWGVLWIVGYAVSAWTSLVDEDVHFWVGGIAWAAIALGGSIGNLVLFRSYFRRVHERRPKTALSRGLFRMNVALTLLGLSLPFVFGGAEHINVAWLPFWVAVIYILNGVFLGRELVILGGWLLLTVFALHLTTSDWLQAVILGLAGGGSLIATGLIFRRRVRSRAHAS
jgi:hypothetical protein